METTSNINVLTSESNDDQEHQASNLLAKRGQPTLRLILNPDESLDELPRRYSQSTSGRVSSTGTAPPLSRASEIERDSRMRSFVDRTLRRYPSVVPQRTAKDSCSSVPSDLRYERNDSIGESLPVGTVKSIPWGHLPDGKGLYASGMDDDVSPLEAIYQARRDALADLVTEFGDGFHVRLAEQIERRAGLHPELADSLTSFKDQSYISRALKRIKNIGEEPAYALEVIFGKPRHWMGIRPTVFASAELQRAWDRSAPAQRAVMEQILLLHIQALQAAIEAVPEIQRPQKAV